MTTEFVRFPRTPHLVVLGRLDVRDDKVLSPQEAEDFLSREVAIEEKIDGENLGLSVVDGRLVAQARGSYVELGRGSFRGLKSWLGPRSVRITDEIGEDLIIFGEWCAVKHSVSYTRLPDWLLVFDVYDRRSNSFWPLEERDLLAETLNLSLVPRLAVGNMDLASVKGEIGQSHFGRQLMEGVVLRQLADPRSRAKIVRPDFVQAIGEHWRSIPPESNRLAFG